MQEMISKNQLAGQTSPYLEQHKDNPVNWQIWSDAAFRAAKTHKRPILLSIGYAACHWCHVMAHECFEDAEVAQLMNRHFICIKLDREERPDIDALYMKALSLLGIQGGWPLTMFLDADARPFWGGTYFPKYPQNGLPGFMQILEEIARVYHDEPEKIHKNAHAISQALSEREAEMHAGAFPHDLPARAARSIAAYIDKKKGGFGQAPKFPQPFLYEFVWRHYIYSKDEALAQSVLASLEAMCRGGLYDHIGGGFSRYAVDEDWLIPHFEKMLYDNALLVDVLVFVWKQTRNPLFARRIADTLAWVSRETKLAGGGFASSLDADSEGQEGKAYLWEKQEISDVLGAAAEAFCAEYNISSEGNFEGKNILHRLGAQQDESEEKWAAARHALRIYRDKRPQPACDDKILADWNGMMITALCKAGSCFAHRPWIDMAEAAFAHISTRLTAGDKLYHSARGKWRLTVSLGDDYAHMCNAALSLYSVSGNDAYLAQCERWMDVFIRDFWDGGKKAFAANMVEDHIITRSFPIEDNAVPSLNAVALCVLAKLYAFTGKPDYESRAHELRDAFAGHVQKHYVSMTAYLNACDLVAQPINCLLIDSADSFYNHPLLKPVAQHALPNVVIQCIAPNQSLPLLHPAYGKQQIDGKPTLYICPGKQCMPPLTEAHYVQQMLDNLQKAG